MRKVGILGEKFIADNLFINGKKKKKMIISLLLLMIHFVIDDDKFVIDDTFVIDDKIVIGVACRWGRWQDIIKHAHFKHLLVDSDVQIIARNSQTNASILW